MSDTTAIAVIDRDGLAVLEKGIVEGNLEGMTPAERLALYTRTCSSLGLNPLTRPFEYIKLNGKLTLYARKDATDQLRFLHTVSVRIIAREVIEGCYVVTASASLPNGRTDESTGAVPIEGLKGDARANALMKCETKAKRRVTLSICGLGFLDESETDSIPGATAWAEPSPSTPTAQASAIPPKATLSEQDDFRHLIEIAARVGFKAQRPIFAVYNVEAGDRDALVAALPTVVAQPSGEVVIDWPTVEDELRFAYEEAQTPADTMDADATQGELVAAQRPYHP